METKEIQKLIDFIAQSGLDEVNIETADLKIKVKRYGTAPVVSYTSAPVAAPAPALFPAAAAPATSAAPAEPAVSKESASSNLITIKSPMIGTFYRV